MRPNVPWMLCLCAVAAASCGGGDSDPSYVVTYDGNGATSGSAPIDPQHYLAWAQVTALGPGGLARTGHTFAVWNTAPDGSGRTVAPGATFVMGPSNVTLHAVWSPNADVLLKNDQYSPGEALAFQGGFVAGEAAAVRLGPTGLRSTLQQVELMFGGAEGTRTVTLAIYDESSPGSPLYSADHALTGSSTALQVIDLSGAGIELPLGATIRVAIWFQHSGLPSVSRDTDGTIYSGRNWVYTSSAWVGSEDLGIFGDWIIRAYVRPW
jgi:hypothetical protein